ncbi:transposase [Bacillus swezeyi]|uniref:transposase n=1 Tax=Bacillus swezeyi TaxID=1925020 RepID=UPI0039C65D12
MFTMNITMLIFVLKTKLTCRTTNREGYRIYASDPNQCEHCPLLNQCTENRNYQKMIHRHLWQNHLEEAEHFGIRRRIGESMSNAKKRLKGFFADLKHKHGLRWTTLRRKKKLSMQAMLVFVAMNLKKLENWTWKCPKRQPFH